MELSSIENALKNCTLQFNYEIMNESSTRPVVQYLQIFGTKHNFLCILHKAQEQ